MYKINFETPIHVHFIGIGGISMSGLAEILLKLFPDPIIKNLPLQITLSRWVQKYSTDRKLLISFPVLM